jgi:hypothetical protein|nr:MAG TPA: hypothetical protein [Bacteriophage sp.]
MNRLTERIDNVPDGESGVWVKNHNYVSAAEKLAEYEDLEEQGRLVILPCKDVYSIVDINNPKYATVMKRPIRELTIYEIESIDKENCKYFSTEEKTEAKLKERRKN